MSYAEELRANYSAARKRLNSGKYLDLPPPPKKHPKPMSYSGWCVGEMWNGVAPAYFDPPPMRAVQIISAVLEVTHVSRNDFMSNRRYYQFVEARHIASWFMKNYTSMSFPQIGRLIGMRDHSTIIHGVKRVEARPDRFGANVAKVAAILNLTLPQEAAFQ